MNANKIRNLEDLKIDDFIWYVYVFIIVAALYSNKIEKEYILEGDRKKWNEYHSVNLVVLTIVFLIYIYFVFKAYELYDRKKDFTSQMNLIAAILFLVSGGILLFLEVSGNDEENELAI